MYLSISQDHTDTSLTPLQLLLKRHLGYYLANETDGVINGVSCLLETPPYKDKIKSYLWLL